MVPRVWNSLLDDTTKPRIRLAPTENMLHDATSLDNRKNTCHITFRGFIGIRALDSMTASISV